MSELKTFFNYIMAFYQVEINLYGFSFTFLDMFVFACLVGIIFWMIGRIFF